jgi:hypothetical protein
MAQLGDPSSLDSEFRALAQDVQRRLRGGNPAVSAVRAAGEAAGRLCAAEAAERVRESMRTAAAACNARNGGVHALSADELNTVADALETLVGGVGSSGRGSGRGGGGGSGSDGRGRGGGDDRGGGGGNSGDGGSDDVHGHAAAAHALACALVPTFFAPLLGAPGHVPAAVTAAADDVAMTWREGDCVVKAAGTAVAGLGGCGAGAPVCSAAIIEHLPSSSDMAPRVAEAAAEFFSGEVARGHASPPSVRALVDDLTKALLEHATRHVQQVVAAVTTFGVRREEWESEDRNNGGGGGGGGEEEEEEEGSGDEGEAAGSAAFAAVLGALERDTPLLALLAVDSVADGVYERFATMSALGVEVAAKKLRALITPILTSINHAYKFRRAVLKKAETKLALLAGDVKRASSAAGLLHRLSRMGMPPTPTPSPEPSMGLPELPGAKYRPKQKQPAAAEDREEVNQSFLPPTKKIRSNPRKTQAGDGVSMLTLAADELEGGDGNGTTDWSSFVIDGVEGECEESDRVPVSSRMGRSINEADATAIQLGGGETAPPQRSSAPPQRAAATSSPPQRPAAAAARGVKGAVGAAAGANTSTTQEKLKGKKPLARRGLDSRPLVARETPESLAARAIASSEGLRKAMKGVGESPGPAGGGGTSAPSAAAEEAAAAAAAAAVEALAGGGYFQRADARYNHGEERGRRGGEKERGADTTSSAGGTGDNMWLALGLASQQITGAKRPTSAGAAGRAARGVPAKKAKPSHHHPPSSPGGLGSLAAAAISEEEDRRVSALDKTKPKAKATTKAAKVAKAGKATTPRPYAVVAAAAAAAAAASPSGGSGGHTPLATPSPSRDDHEDAEPRAALALHKAVAQLDTQPHATAAPADGADDVFVATALGKLCAAMLVELPAGATATFAKDLARCPASIRNVLLPLAQGSRHLLLMPEGLRFSKPSDKSPAPAPALPFPSFSGGPSNAAPGALPESNSFNYAAAAAAVAKGHKGLNKIFSHAAYADAFKIGNAEGARAGTGAAWGAAAAGGAGGGARASTGASAFGAGGSGGGAGFHIPTPLEHAAAAAAAAAAMGARVRLEKTKPKQLVSPLSPNAFAFDGSEVARQVPY